MRKDTTQQIKKRNLPLYWKLAEMIKANIRAGKYRVGDFLPAERQLAEDFDLSRVTVRKAIERLLAEGIVENKKRLGYQILAATEGRAAKVPTQKTLFICMPFYPIHYIGNQLLACIEKELLKYNCNLVLKNHDEDVKKEAAFLQEFLNQQVDGLFLMLSVSDPQQYPTIDFPKLLRTIPVVFVDRHLPGVHGDFVGTNNLMSAFDLVSYLIKKGHRKIGFISNERTSTMDERYLGYVLAHHTHNLPLEPAYIHFEFQHQNIHFQYGIAGYDSTEQLLKTPSPPTAIFAANDFITTGIVKALDDSHLRIPEDVSVVGFDNDVYALNTLPIKLTTVEQDCATIAAMAVSKMMQKIQQPSDYQDSHTTFPATIIERESVANITT